jgi:hypothetical protein
VGIELVRVLCVCKNGNVRSVALARILKGRDHQVLVLGAKDFCAGDDYDIRVALEVCQWAEVIYCQKDSERYLLQIIGDYDTLTRKIDLRYDVGPDDWKIPSHPDLLVRLRDLVNNDLEMLV